MLGKNSFKFKVSSLRVGWWIRSKAGRLGFKLVVVGVLAVGLGYAQKENQIELKFGNTITQENLKKHLSVLASDEYEGRETGERGQKMAATYIAEQFKKIGLKPGFSDTSFFQRFPLDVQLKKEVFITLNNKEYIANTDYISFYGLSEQQLEVNDIVFAGYGIGDKNYADYKKGINKKVSVKDKAVLVLDGEPMGIDSMYLTSKTKKPTDWTTNYKKKEEVARAQGAKLLLIAVSNIDSAYKQYRHRIFSTSMIIKKKTTKVERIPVVFISKKMADNIVAAKEKDIYTWRDKISDKKKTFSEALKADLKIKIVIKEKTITSENVLGYMEGTDLKNELVVVTAHYDHLGVQAGNVVFNGADDDGSGTVSVIEIAEAFMAAKKDGKGPRRSMLFMTVAGEEKGLLGSEYYTDNPVYPLKSTVADLNIDMVGRVDAKHKDSIDYIYIIGSDKLSTELHQINEKANKEFAKLKLDYTYNDVHDVNRYYYRSDHYNFARFGIPVIFYFNGTHADYHKETDEVSKINFELMERRARLVFFTAWELVNRTERIKVDVKQ